MSSVTEPITDTPFDVVLEALRRGDDAAWCEMLGRYSKRLVGLARSRLFNDSLRPKVDADDVVQSVLRTFHRQNRLGKLNLASWGALWGLLVALTVYRAARWDRHFRTLKRDLTREMQLDVVANADENRPSTLRPPIDPHPQPDEVAELMETVRETLAKLPESQRRVIELGLMGFDDKAIRETAGPSEERVSQIREDLAEALQNAADSFVKPADEA